MLWKCHVNLEKQKSLATNVEQIVTDLTYGE